MFQEDLTVNAPLQKKVSQRTNNESKNVDKLQENYLLPTITFIFLTLGKKNFARLMSHYILVMNM